MNEVFNKFNKKELESILKASRRYFWVNLVLVALNFTMAIITLSWMPLIVSGLFIFLAFVQKGIERDSLIKLGREDEL